MAEGNWTNYGINISASSIFTFSNINVDNYTRIYRVGDLLIVGLVFYTPSTVSSNPKIWDTSLSVSGPVFAQINECWSGANCGLINIGSNSAFLADDDWLPNKRVSLYTVLRLLPGQ